jgi:hypothetical protein
MDGKYLATASTLGIVSIFDSKTGKESGKFFYLISPLVPDGINVSVMKDLYEKDLPGYTNA